MRGIWLLGLVLTLIALTSTSSAADKKKPAKDGSSVATYTVKLEEKETAPAPRGVTEQAWEFTLKIFDVPGEKYPRRAIFVIEPLPEKAAPSLPIAALQVRPDGKMIVDLAHPQERSFTDAFLNIVRVSASVPQKRLKALEAGTDRIELTGLRLDKKIPVTFETKVQQKNPELIDYRVQLDGDEVVSDFGKYRVELNAFSEYLVFSKEELRFMGGKWTRTTTQDYAGKKTTKELKLRVIEEAREALSADEVKAVEEEYALLLPVARAVLPGFVHDTDKDKITESLEDYRKGYGDGHLAAAFPSLEEKLIAKLPDLGKLYDPDAKAAELMGKQAPAFALKDLDGNEISFEKLKGNVVLLEFWAYD